MTAKKKTTYVATAPDGTEHTRTSNRVYTHAVLVYGPSWDNPEPHWGCVSFNGREELAHKEARSWAGRFEKIIVVPVSHR